METNKKKLYEKPKLQEVKLVPEEAVLVACKSSTVSGVNSCGSRAACGFPSRSASAAS